MKKPRLPRKKKKALKKNGVSVDEYLQSQFIAYSLYKASVTICKLAERIRPALIRIGKSCQSIKYIGNEE